MKKLMFVFGTRPETIKMAPLIHEFARNRQYTLKICVSGQHREMLDPFTRIFKLKADYDLAVMRQSQNLFEVTSHCLAGLREVFLQEQPDLVLVQGDTTTAFCGALAAFYLNIPLAHVEAGLRTGDLGAPFPEEGNRSMISRLAQLHFAPTASARAHLLAEGIPTHRIHVTGNTVIDALFWMRERLNRDKQASSLVPDDVKNAFAPGRKVILVTGHRRENFGEGFRQVCFALKDLAERFPEVRIVYPVHLNPNVQKHVHEILGASGNIQLREPAEYPEFVYMLEHCSFVITDSGGIQEEAPSFGKPVLVTRDTSERPEAIAAGTVKLLGTDRAGIVEYASRLLTDEPFLKSMSYAHSPYGDGQASARICGVVDDFFRVQQA